MKPIDYRNETWDQVQARVTDLRMEVWRAFLRHGPGTTREVARRIGWDVVNLRPRATELYQIGFLELVEDLADKARSREGVYVALTDEQARLRYLTERQKHLSHQPELPLK